MTQQNISTRTKQELEGTEGTRPGRWFVPDIDIAETPEALWLWADMPGVDENAVEVKLNDGILSIEGRLAVEDYAGLQPVYTEYNVGNFAKRLVVSSDFDVENIVARMKDGVLELKLPKAERAKARKIQIQTN